MPPDPRRLVNQHLAQGPEDRIVARVCPVGSLALFSRRLVIATEADVQRGARTIDVELPATRAHVESIVVCNAGDTEDGSPHWVAGARLVFAPGQVERYEPVCELPDVLAGGNIFLFDAAALDRMRSRPNVTSLKAQLDAAPTMRGAMVHPLASDAVMQIENFIWRPERVRPCAFVGLMGDAVVTFVIDFDTLRADVVQAMLRDDAF